MRCVFLQNKYLPTKFCLVMFYFVFRAEMFMCTAHGVTKLGRDGMYLHTKNILIIMGHVLNFQAFLFR
jgi:hypothetical protein